MDTKNLNSTSTYWLCPLYSFDCDCESIDLAEGIQIKLAPSELRDYIQEQTFYLYGRWDDPSEVKWAAFLPYRAKAIEGAEIENIEIGLEEWHRVRELLVDLVTSLRLCHKGHVTVGPLILASFNSSKWSIGGNDIWTRVSQKDFLHEKPKYLLRQLEISQINELIKKVNNLREGKKLGSIDVALRRFHSAYHGDIEDRIIDQMIAFESLYLGDPQELTYKLALRTAFLLGKRKDKRNAIFGDIKKAYNYRSRIVHGDNPPNREELRDIVPKTEEYLRRSIRRFLLLLSQGHSLKEIREKLLDENILKNGKFLTSYRQGKCHPLK